MTKALLVQAVFFLSLLLGAAVASQPCNTNDDCPSLECLAPPCTSSLRCVHQVCTPVPILSTHLRPFNANKPIHACRQISDHQWERTTVTPSIFEQHQGEYVRPYQQILLAGTTSESVVLNAACQVVVPEQSNLLSSQHPSQVQQQQKESLVCHTAYAYDMFGICFSDFGMHHWGWTLDLLTERPYQLDLYAKTDTDPETSSSTHSCDIHQGTVVGSLEVKESTAVFYAGNGYYLQQVHLYVGNQPFPKTPEGQQTTRLDVLAKGRDDVNAAQATVALQVEGLDENKPMHMIAQAIVCEEGIY